MFDSYVYSFRFITYDNTYNETSPQTEYDTCIENEWIKSNQITILLTHIYSKLLKFLWVAQKRFNAEVWYQPKAVHYTAKVYTITLYLFRSTFVNLSRIYVDANYILYARAKLPRLMMLSISTLNVVLLYLILWCTFCRIKFCYSI